MLFRSRDPRRPLRLLHLRDLQLQGRPQKEGGRQGVKRLTAMNALEGSNTQQSDIAFY